MTSCAGAAAYLRSGSRQAPDQECGQPLAVLLERRATNLVSARRCRQHRRCRRFRFRSRRVRLSGRGGCHRCPRPDPELWPCRGGCLEAEGDQRRGRAPDVRRRRQPGPDPPVDRSATASSRSARARRFNERFSLELNIDRRSGGASMPCPKGASLTTSRQSHPAMSKGRSGFCRPGFSTATAISSPRWHSRATASTPGTTPTRTPRRSTRPTCETATTRCGRRCT